MTAIPPERESLLHSFEPPNTDGLAAKRTDFWNPTLSIQFVEGDAVAFLYSHLHWMNFHPTKGIILHFSTHTVKIQGRNLKGLYAELREFKAREIVIVAEEHDLDGPDAVVVHKVGVKEEHSNSHGAS